MKLGKSPIDESKLFHRFFLLFLVARLLLRSSAPTSCEVILRPGEDPPTLFVGEGPLRLLGGEPTGRAVLGGDPHALPGNAGEKIDDLLVDRPTVAEEPVAADRPEAGDRLKIQDPCLLAYLPFGGG